MGAINLNRAALLAIDLHEPPCVSELV